MTTQEQPATDAPPLRRYQVFWNDDGEYVSNLTYTEEQINEIDEIVFTVVRGLLDANRIDLTVTHEPDTANDGGNS